MSVVIISTAHDETWGKWRIEHEPYQPGIDKMPLQEASFIIRHDGTEWKWISSIAGTPTTDQGKMIQKAQIEAYEYLKHRSAESEQLEEYDPHYWNVTTALSADDTV